jgi:hypothetical protein
MHVPALHPPQSAYSIKVVRGDDDDDDDEEERCRTWGATSYDDEGMVVVDVVIDSWLWCDFAIFVRRIF